MTRANWLRSVACSSTLKSALRLFVHSNVHISAAAAGLAISSTLVSGFPLDPIPVFIVFAVTLFVYSVNRVTDIREDVKNVPRRATFTKRYGWIWLVIGGSCYAIAILLASSWDRRGGIYLTLPFLVIVVYSVLRFKRVLVLKNVLVGGSWAIIPLGVGVYYGDPSRPEVVLLVGYVAIMLTIAAMICDVNDIVGDTAEGIRTVPNVYSPKTARRVGVIGNLLVTIALLTAVGGGYLSQEMLVFLVANGYILGYTFLATPDRSELFYGFIIDSEHLIVATIFLIAEAVL